MTDETPKNGPGPGWVRFEPPLMLMGGGLDDLVRRALPGARATGVEFLDRGVVNSNYRVDLAWEAPGKASPAVVRLRLSRSDEGPLREGALGERLSKSIPLPRLLASSRGEDPEPHRRSLFTWIEGRSLDEAVSGDGPGRGLDLAADDLARALARLHRETMPAFGRLNPDLTLAAGSTSRWPDDLARRVDVRLGNPAHGLSSTAVASIRAGFDRRLSFLGSGPPIGPALVHGDLSPGNILVREAGGGRLVLAGLIDWEMARSADPALDWASLRFEMAERWPRFAARAEERYRESNATEVSPEMWGRRVAVAAVPLLLDARMVAARRGDRRLLDRIDARIEAALNGGSW